jgi:type VI secretion system protein ImpG
VPRGIEVDSVPVEGTPCRFRTAYEVTLHPLTLEEVAVETAASGRSTLRLGFRLWNQVRPEAIRLDRLRLHLHGDGAVTLALYHHLMQHVADARVTAGRGDREESRRRVTFAAAGFGDDEALLPYPIASFPGYRHLQEYFALPEKYLFVDVLGLERLDELGVTDQFRIEIDFDRALSPSLRPTREEIRLYCTPIVNLFAHEGDPIRLERDQSEYRIRPAGRDSLHYEVYSIERVSAWDAAAGEEREIMSFHDAMRVGAGARAAFYAQRLRNSVVDDRVDVYVSFVDAKAEAIPPFAETVSFALTCTNRRRPEALRAGDIGVATDTSPAFVRFRNLTAPTPSVAPPLGGDVQWPLISHLSQNHLSLTEIDALRGVLEVYNFQARRNPQAARASARRLEGLDSIRAEPAVILYQGCPLRGSRVTLEVLEDRFAGDGDLFLFATLLDEFLGLHATLNSFIQLRVHGLQRGETLTWPCRTGRELL